MLRQRFCSCAILSICAFASCALSAATPSATLVGGETIEVTGQRLETITVGETQFPNRENHLYVTGDATISVTYPEGVHTGGFWFAPHVTGGTLTIDLTALAATDTFRLDYGLVTKGDGRVVIKGRDSVDLGGGRFSASGGNFSPPADCPNLAFVTADGTPFENPKGLVLCERFLEVNLPTTVPWSIAPNATATVYRADSAIVAGLADTANRRLTLNGGFDLWTLNTNAIAADLEIVVPAGREFTLIPRTLTEGTKSDTKYYDQSSYNNLHLPNAVTLQGGTFNVRNHYSTHLDGALAGSGTLRITATKEAIAASLPTLAFNGVCSFAGALSIETISARVAFNQSSPGAAGNAVSLIAQAQLELLGTGNGAIGALTGPASGTPATITLASGLTLAVGSRAGLVDFAGASTAASRVVFGSLSSGETLANAADATVTLAVSDELAADARLVTLARTDGLNTYHYAAADEIVDVGSLARVSGGAFVLAARDGLVYQNIPSDVRFEVGSGVTATLEAAADGDDAAVVAEGGLLVVRESAAWKKKIRFDVDPSNAATVTTDGTRQVAGVTCGQITSILDASGTDTVSAFGYYSSTETTWPSLVPSGCNGLSTISCDYGGNRRLWIKTIATGKTFSFKPAMCVMVFGSQLGGGQALLGNADGAYCRGGTLDQKITKDAPIFADATIPTWVDGVSVNPSKTELSGGWQILSIDTSIAAVGGLGYNAAVGTSKNASGQNYGEVIFFGEALTETERRQAERFLAKKWGLPLANGITFALRATGSGEIRLETDVTLAGSFTGTLDLNGNNVTFADLPLPPGEEVVPGVAEGRLAWFDPTVTESLFFRSDGRTLNQFYSRDRLESSPGDKFLNAAGRPPIVRCEARGTGPARNWLFYSPYEQSGAVITKAGTGNSLRFNEFQQAEDGTVDKPLTCQTIILVQDSAHGGGTPFLEDRNGTGQFGARWARRSDTAENAVVSAADPIWNGNSVTTMSTGHTYLDGVEVDGSKVGFGGRPEVFAATRADGLTIGYFADLYYQNDVTNLVAEGEIQGEILMFDSVLSSAQMKAVDAYLAWKWLGEARAGYATASGLTLTGAGSVAGAKAGDLPNFGASFTGSAALTGSTHAFALAKDGSVTGRISAPAATLELPAACTAAVSVAAGVPAGDYVLIDAAAFASETTWTLLPGDCAGAPSLKLAVREGQLILTVQKNGLVILVR